MAIPAIDRNVLHMQVKACFKLTVLLGNYQRDVSLGKSRPGKVVSSSDSFHIPPKTYLKPVGGEDYAVRVFTAY